MTVFPQEIIYLLRSAVVIMSPRHKVTAAVFAVIVGRTTISALFYAIMRFDICFRAFLAIDNSVPFGVASANQMPRNNLPFMTASKHRGTKYWLQQISPN